MRKFAYSLFAAALVALSGCQDDAVVEEQTVVPAQTGDEIVFGSSLKTINTRTVYDDEPYQEGDKSYYRVSWEATGDTISIYCPQASNRQLVNYVVTPDANDATTSSLVTKVDADAAGLQWGEGEGENGTHHFYGFYPGNRVTGTEQGKIRAYISPTQNVDHWNVVSENGGTTYYGKTNTDYAFMWAYGKFDRATMGNQSVPLTFHPWMTVLEITIPGPTSSTSVTISNINIIANEGQQTVLAGPFVCDMSKVVSGEKETPDYVPVSSSAEVNNIISISGYNAEKDEFITLGPGDKMVVRAYLLPIDDQNTVNARNIQVRVATTNGAPRTRTLGYSNHGEHSIQPHKVNKVILPPLEVSYETNYWMSSIDPDVFVTELSWPGSKMSLLTKLNNANIVYQSTTIEEQLNDGVRAFIFQTQREYNDTLYLSANGNRINTTLSQGLRQIATFLDEAEQKGRRESAFVLVTYNGGQGSQRDWMRSLQSTINDCANDDQYRIFDGDLSHNTTLSDVANQIIVKCNYNSTDMIANVGTAPMLYSLWEVPYVEGGLDMPWSNPHGSKAFTWLYQEVTSVLDPIRNTCDADGSGEWWDSSTTPYSCEATKAEKEAYIRTIFKESVEAYQTSNHDIWFMSDLGGYYGYCTANHRLFNDDHDEHIDVIGLTQDMNNLGVQLLQERTENAGLGLVFMNFANRDKNSGQLYRSDWLIQTIIDNNFKFQLRKKGGSENQSYNATYNNGGNAIGWDNQ